MHPSVTPATPRAAERDPGPEQDRRAYLPLSVERLNASRTRLADAREAYRQVMACAQNPPVALAAYDAELAR